MTCRICGCTDEDCSGCIRRTGERCHWVEPNLCSACAPARRKRKPTCSWTPKLTPAQQAAFDSKARFVILHSGRRRGGMSYSDLHSLLSALNPQLTHAQYNQPAKAPPSQ